MAYRVSLDSITKYATTNNLVGVSFLFVMFMMLIGSGSIVLTGYSGDSLCAGTIEEPCYAYVNFTAMEDIFIDPTNDTTWAFQTTPENRMKNIIMQRSWGTGWRDIDLSKPYTSTVDYALKLSKGQDYQFRFVGYKYNITDTVEWGFGFQQDNETNSSSYIDPEWTGYTYNDVFTNLTYNAIEGDKGIAIFEVTNPLSVPITLPIEAWSQQFDKVNGDVKSSKIELVTDTDEIVVKEVPNTVCVDTIEEICSIDNQTLLNTCVNFTTPICEIQGTKLINVIKPKGTIKPLRKVIIEPNDTVTMKLTADLVWLPQINIEWFVFINVLGVNFKSEDWAWWNVSFDSRRQIEINTTSDITNYQVKMVFTNNTNYQADWEDIRFTGIYANCSEDISQLRPYWVENKVDSTNVTVWVNASLYTACNNGTQLFNYYNNADVTNVSDGKNTLILNDEYNVGTLDTSYWSAEKKGSASATVEETTYDGKNVLHLSGASTIISSGSVVSKINITANNFIIEFERYMTHENYGGVVFGSGAVVDLNGGSTDWFETQLYSSYDLKAQSNTAGQYIKLDSGTRTVIVNNLDVINSGQWVYHKMIYTSDGDLNWSNSLDGVTYTDVGSPPYTDTALLPMNKLLMLSQGEYSGGQGGSSYYNYVRVRQYTASTPTYSIGAEESQTADVEFIVTLNSPANETITTDTTPDFDFTSTGTELNYSCELFIGAVGYGINATTLNNTATIITANDTLSDGTYDWKISCTSGAVTNSSEIRSITIIYKIGGTVKDSNLVVIDSATVIIINQSDNTIIGTNTTDVNGNWTYTIDNGTYIVVAYNPNNESQGGSADPFVVV